MTPKAEQPRCLHDTDAMTPISRCWSTQFAMGGFCGRGKVDVPAVEWIDQSRRLLQ